MAKKTIMLVCSAGMSTSLLVTKMQKAAEEKGLETDIFAVSASDADNSLEEKNVDVLLLGPQVRFESSVRTKIGTKRDSFGCHQYGRLRHDERGKSFGTSRKIDWR
jgi:PTS system cellobiose-specific IIB component